MRTLPPQTGAFRALIVAAGFVFIAGCSGTNAPSPDSGDAARDIHSYARPDEIRVTHLVLDWDVRFEPQSLEGSALLHIARGPRSAGAPLRLDTRDLQIATVLAGAGTAGGRSGLQETDWHLEDRDPHLGSELVIELPEEADRVLVKYRTDPSATGLQWLTKEQTTGGRQPFLYTQSQAIHARSWIPCQDSPAVRVTYEAKVRVGAPLRAVMAALQIGSPVDGPDGVRTHTYAMRHPIPPYLIALAVGELTFGEVGPRTGIWAEPEVLPKAVREFADMERMLEVSEAIFGEYRWDRYDILVLPPSFPFGGMENPMLTFATPTVLAGDRSLVSLVAHELAHSWSGNLVTNATWSDFWLNEGFTSYLERRIMEAVYGQERAEMEWMLGRQDLDQEFVELADKPEDQVLHIDLTGRDPDDGMTDVPYEKGALLLRQLEEAYGRQRFDSFLRSWFDEHAFTSLTTAAFLSFLDERLLSRSQPIGGAGRPDIDAWVNRPGLPETAPVAASDLLGRVKESAQRWSAGDLAPVSIDINGWSTHQWLHFLRSLPDDLTAGSMGELDTAFGLTRTGNSEILDEWLVLAVRHDYRPAFDRLESFLTEQGRRKYLKPLYQELVKTGEGKERARGIYARARPLYHAISRRTLDEIVGWP